MRIRYFSYLALVVAAAFMAIATWAFSLPTVVALSLGVGVGMLAVSAGAAALYREDPASVMVNGAIAAISAWTVVASQVFSQLTVSDLTFASALAIGGLAIIGLTVHELDTERVVHRLEVHEGRDDRSRSLGRAAA